MSKAWIRAKRGAFVRDVLRDFCLTSRYLEHEFQRFDTTGRLRFEAIRELLGQEMNKGLLWRLKDTSHHLFRNELQTELQAAWAGRIIDWCLGYIFHETIKLKEDAYQQATYGQWFHQLKDGQLSDAEADIGAELSLVVDQTRESIGREVARVRYILAKVRRLLPLYLPRHQDNPLLGRLLFEEEPLVREALGEEYDALLAALYGDAPQHLYVQASLSLRQGGWMTEALRAVAAAEAMAPDDPRVVEEKSIVDNWHRQLAD